MTDLNEEILEFIDKHTSINTLDYAKEHNLDHQKVVGAIKSLQTNDGVIQFLFFNLKLFIDSLFISC